MWLNKKGLAAAAGAIAGRFGAAGGAGKSGGFIESIVQKAAGAGGGKAPSGGGAGGSGSGGGAGGGGDKSGIMKWIMYLLILVVIVGIVLMTGMLNNIFSIVAVIIAAILILLVVRSGMGKGKKIILIIIICVAVFGFFFYFMSVGGAQVSIGGVYQIGKSFSNIFETHALRSLWNTLQNPFAVAPEESTVEDVNTDKAPPANQAFDVEVSGYINSVEFDQKALTFIITVKNTGGSRIRLANVFVGADPPFLKCIRFDTLPAACDQESGPTLRYRCELTDIPAGGSKNLIISNGYVDGDCIANSPGMYGEVSPDTPVNVYLSVKASTYYPTSSRLAVERIDNDYGMLLFQNEMLRAEKTGAIFRAGSAMVINLDIGDQPILDTVDEGGLLISWENYGNGKMGTYTNPFIFFVTPKDFGTCVMRGYEDEVIIVTAETPCNLLLTDCTTKCTADYTASKTRSDAAYTSCMSAAKDAGDEADCTAEKTGRETTMNSKKTSCDTGCTFVNGFCNAITGGEDINACTNIVLTETEDGEIEVVGEKCIICDSALKKSWCDNTSYVYDELRRSAPDIVDAFDWACSRLDSGEYHVCATNMLNPETEFKLFSCTQDLSSALPPATNRFTEYITAISVYPYEVESGSIKISAFCVEGTCP